MPSPAGPYVSRGGLKLQHALDAFALDPAGLRCADLGCSTGGFTDCLLRRGAAHVVGVDTGYGVLAYALRKDPRVTVLERTNALHARPPLDAQGHPDLRALVVLDLSWTPQRLALPAASTWLAPAGRIITLIKPHYELADRSRQSHQGQHAQHQARQPLAPVPPGGVLDEQLAHSVNQQVLADIPALGFRVVACVQSPIRGGTKGDGNIEFLALLARADQPPA
jgi:23S rRNA (cytidine1920-2'-O)/16S rRNA (cytidine1409-2'-O)-methyltransferase